MKKTWKIMAVTLLISLLLSLCACESEAAVAFKAEVDAIGTVTLKSEALIVSAETAFDALKDKEKRKEELVPYVTTLTDARADYDALVEEQTKKVEEAAALIDAIGEVTLDYAPINAAWKAYNAIDADYQTLVKNYDKLVAADESYNELHKAECEKLYNDYIKKFDVEEDPFQGMIFYTPKKMPNYIDDRSYLIPYIGKYTESSGYSGVWIVFRQNYTGDDWLFWTKIHYIVDGEPFVKSFGYNDITRDNAWGNVWEYREEILPVNGSLDSSDYALLRKIADSNETVIRFEGQYSYDMAVSKADKEMINDCLKLYEALLG